MPASSEQGASQMDKFKFIVRPITTTGEPYLHVNTLLGTALQLFHAKICLFCE